MTRKKEKRRSAMIFTNLENLTQPHRQEHEADGEMLDLDRLADQAILPAADTSKTLRMKKFRSQLFHQWLDTHFEPCRAADIGGGKGLLSYLLRQSGWRATVIDPVRQPLPSKYKDIRSGQRVKIDPQAQVPWVEAEFQVEMGREYDLLLGMHAHGCNAKIIDAAQQFGCGFVILPCCVIDEPFYPRLGVHWLESLAGYAVHKGLSVFPFRLNFKGQNIGLCHVGKCRLRS